MLFLIIFIQISPIPAEYIPVFMWEMNYENIVQVEKPAPFLSLNENVFESVILKQLEQNKTIVVFVEDNLSQEDFILRYEGRRTVFPNLTSFVSVSKVLYLPYVQNPFEIVTSNEKLLENIFAPFILKNGTLFKSKLLIVNLNDTTPSENRKDMLRRHDSIIFRVQLAFLELHEKIFGIYTGRHQSWITPETTELYKSKKLLQVNTSPNLTSTDSGNKKNKTTAVIDDKNLLLVISDVAKYSTNNGKTFTSISLGQSDFSIRDKEIKFSLQGGNLRISFSIVFNHGYWKIAQLLMNKNNATFERVEVSERFSYHCTRFKVENSKAKELLIIPGFQIQPFINGSEKASFGVAIDCTGFTTIVIWNVLFVVALLFLILSVGVTCIMDIKTMDRFDDPLQAQFHINVEE